MGQLRYRLINSSNPRIFATKNLGRKFFSDSLYRENRLNPAFFTNTECSPFLYRKIKARNWFMPTLRDQYEMNKCVFFQCELAKTVSVWFMNFYTFSRVIDVASD